MNSTHSAEHPRLPENFSWKEELRRETLTYWYYACETLEELERVVRATAYLILTGEELLEKFSSLDTESTAALHDLSKAGYDAAKESNFEGEWQVAQQTAMEARERLKNGEWYEREFRYIMNGKGVRRVSDGKIEVTFEKKDGETYYIVRNGVDKVGEKDGFPSSFIHREGNLNTFQKLGMDSVQFLKENFQLFLPPGTSAEHWIFQEARIKYFQWVVRQVPFEDSKKQEDFFWSLEKTKHGIYDEEKDQYTAAALFEQLTPAQKELAKQPRTDFVECRQKMEIDAGQEQAELMIGVWFKDVTLYYDPESREMRGSINPNEEDGCRVLATNYLSPQTTHEGLLALRERVVRVCEAIGVTNVGW